MNFAVKNASFSYKKTKPLLSDITFSLKNGEILAILGPNGVGKTTLLKCVIGLLAWQSGASYFNDRKITEIKQRKLWQTIAYVPQAKPTPLSITVREMVVLGRNAHIVNFRQPTQKDYEIADEALFRVGVASLSENLCSELSGGQLQMVLIARALCSCPKLLVLDEPESNLDFKNQLIILQLIKKLAQKNDVSIILNTHYPAHALKISDKSLIMGQNLQQIYGASSDVITEENLEKVFSVKVKIAQVDTGAKTHKTVIPFEII